MTYSRCNGCPPNSPPILDGDLFAHVVVHHPELAPRICGEHCYLSTLCLHDLCLLFPDRCRETCKWCGSACSHACHDPALNDATSTVQPTG